MARSEQPRPTADLDPSTWVEQHGDVLFRYALRRVRDAAVAEDLVQETFLAALKARDRFEGRSAVQTWLVGILKRKTIDWMRTRARRGGATGSDALEAAVSDQYDERGIWRNEIRDWPGGETLIRSREFQQALSACLAKLPGRMGDAFVLREMESMESEEICEVLGISSSNLWTTLFRARSLLRKCLEENWFDREGG